MAEETSNYIQSIRKITARAFVTLAVLFVLPLSASNTNRTIEKAKNLSLQRDRVQASRAIKEGLEEKNLSVAEKNKLKSLLNKLSEIFYSAKSLQDFELASSMQDVKPNESRQRWTEIIKQEAQNTKVLKALSRIDLVTGDCDASQSWIKQAREINPYDEEAIVLEAQAISCGGSRLGFESYLQDPLVDRKSIYIQVSALSVYLQNSDWKAFEQEFSNIVDKDFPETYYFKAKALKQQGESNFLEFFSRYVVLCEEIGKLRKKYPKEPRLCAEVKNIKSQYELPSGSLLQKIVK